MPSIDPHPSHEIQSSSHHAFESLLSEEQSQIQGIPDLEDTINEFASRPFSFQSRPARSPLQLDSSKPTTNSFTLDICHHICRIIFDLRMESAVQSASAESASSSAQQIFSSVASLCDVLQSVLTYREDLPGDLHPPAEESSSTFMLALTAISKVLDRYRSLSQLYSASMMKTPPETISLSHDWLSFDWSSSKASSALPLLQPSTCRHLNDVLQLTTMDFHLAQLQRIFRHLQPKDSSQYAPIAEEGRANMEELRGLLQSSIKALRESA